MRRQKLKTKIKEDWRLNPGSLISDLTEMPERTVGVEGEK